MMISASPPPLSNSSLEAVRTLLALAQFFGDPSAVKARIAEYEAARVAAVEAANKASEEAEAALLEKYAEREAAIAVQKSSRSRKCSPT